MVKPVAGDVVVVPFPQTDLQVGKRRPALVVAALPGSDMVLCQITSQFRSDAYSVPLEPADFEQGRLTVASYARAGRLFTVDQAVIVYTAGRISQSKLEQVRARIRQLFA